MFPCPETKDEKCLMYLETQTICSLNDLFRVLKNAPLKDKRYCSLHLFARLYVNDYTAPAPPKNVFVLRKFILKKFQDIEMNHRKLMTGPFFNYPWLLKKILNEFKIHQYNPYIKPIKCKRRRKHYEKMYSTLGCTDP